MMEKAEVPIGMGLCHHFVIVAVVDSIHRRPKPTTRTRMETCSIISISDLTGSGQVKPGTDRSAAKAYELMHISGRGDIFFLARMPDLSGRRIFPLTALPKYVTVVDVCAVRLVLRLASGPKYV